ncbi:MAG: hypothetical protein WAN35_04970 [Terracidiphilus sp.]
MRIPHTLIVALLCAASSVAALGQQAAATPSLPSGLYFSLDAPHGQISANGYTVKSVPNLAASTDVSGTIVMTLTIKLVTKFKKDTNFTCGATVIAGQLDTSNFVLDGGLETASGIATVNPSNPSWATCTLTIPYDWSLQNDSLADTGMVVAFAAAGVNWRGRTERSTLQIIGFEALPTNGSTTTFAFSPTL